MRFKKMNEQEWLKIGNQARNVRKELFNLMGMSYSAMPKATVEPLLSALKSLDKFRSRAEDRMIKVGDSENLNIFFGDVKNIEYKEERE